MGRRNSFYWVGPLEHTGPGLSGVVCDRASLVRRSSHSATAPRSPPPPRPVRSQGSLPATAPCPNLHRRGGVLQSGRLDSSPSLSLALGLSLCCGGRSDSSTRSANQLSTGRGRTQGRARGLSGEKAPRHARLPPYLVCSPGRSSFFGPEVWKAESDGCAEEGDGDASGCRILAGGDEEGCGEGIRVHRWPPR